MSKLRGLSAISKVRIFYYLPSYLFGVWFASGLPSELNNIYVYIVPLISTSIIILFNETNYYMVEKELKISEDTKREYKELVEEFVAIQLEVGVDEVEMIHKEGVVARVRVGEKVYEVLVGETTFLIIGGKIINEGTDLVLENGGSVS